MVMVEFSISFVGGGGVGKANDMDDMFPSIIEIIGEIEVLHGHRLGVGMEYFKKVVARSGICQPFVDCGSVARRDSGCVAWRC
ncbi:MAG: hypothetical protein EOL87_15340 [Spartobacteria bacterium]|nr:hypothetical protein [Spartobacteria bacterium]